jgi:general secretion pathway protein I
MTTSRHFRGFTLVEVMVALVIVSIALASMTVTMGSMLNNATTLRERTYASWIAQNKIVEYRLANEVPDTGTTSGEVDYANVTWEWEANIDETGIENLLRIDVSVGFAGSNQVIRTVTGFIGEPVPPGQSNRAWTPGGQDDGDTR